MIPQGIEFRGFSDAARYFGCSAQTVSNWIARGDSFLEKIPASRDRNQSNERALFNRTGEVCISE